MAQVGLGGFGDARLARVGERLLAAMRDRPSLCLHALASGRAEALAFGRFLDHSAVSSAEMLTTAGRLTGERAAGRHVLAIQDTTELAFPDHKASKSGFGLVGNGAAQGLFLHPTIAVEAESGGVLGLAGAQVINRISGPAEPRRSRPLEAKESYRWLVAAETAGDVLAAAAMVTMVADRESDIYELFARRPAGVHLLSRSAQDRRRADGGKLSASIAEWPALGQVSVALPARPGHAARTARVALRAGQVTLRRPASADQSLPETVTLSVVEVAECDTPDFERPLHWRLLTTHAVPDLATAQQVVAWYRLRWRIEEVFRTLKSAALKAEASQVTEAFRFAKLATVALIAAVRILQIVIGRDGSTGQPIADAIEPSAAPALAALNRKLEGRTTALSNPHPNTSLAWLAWIVGRLGGWSGYTSKGYKPPGPKTVARGLSRLDGFLEGWYAAQQANHSKDVRLP